MMLTTLIALSLQVMAGDCSFEPGPTTGDIEVIAPARGTVILELRVAGQAPPPTALLHELEQRDIPATVLVSTSWAKRHGESLRGLDKKGHEVGYWLNLMSDLSLSSDLAVAPNLAHWVRSLRDGREVVEAATKADIRTIGVLRLPEVGEKAMEGLGFKAILPAERTVRDEPRRIASLHSAAGRARVLGEGPYDDGCGAQLPAWTPASLDRATRVAARGGWVRIALPTDPAGAPLLARWLDEVVVPQKWRVVTASEAARLADPGLGAPQVTAPPTTSTSHRVLPAERFTPAAQTLLRVASIPRQLPGRLTPTETFLGLAQLITTAPSTVTLGPLRPPGEIARSSLGLTPVPLTPADVRAATRDIMPGLSGQVPGFVTVGGHTLTAAEFLRVMAMVHLGEAPVAQPIDDPDPYAPGGGWGESSGL